MDVQTRTPGALRIGNTPLVRLEAFEIKPGVEIHAKLEFHNAGGSVKDRAALAMVEDGERRGLLGPGRVLLDATSGNTGISYAMLGASRGFPVKLCVPANVTRERRLILQSYGADLVLTDPMDGSDGAIQEARRIFASDPDRYFYPDQYSNDANWRAHYETTGVEILEQTGGNDHALRRRPRHQRHVHRHGPPAARLGTANRAHRGAAGFAAARARRAQAHGRRRSCRRSSIRRSPIAT